MPTASDTFTLTIPSALDVPKPLAPYIEVKSRFEVQEITNGDEYTAEFVYSRGRGDLKAANSPISVAFSAPAGGAGIADTVKPSGTVTPLHTGNGGSEQNSGSISGAVPFLTEEQLVSAVSWTGVVAFDYPHP